jgi:hypothetical protein
MGIGPFIILTIFSSLHLQMHSVRDAEILRQRNQPVGRPEPKDPRAAAVIKAGHSAPFEVTFLDPPKEYRGISFVLKNFDENSMKEIFADKLTEIKKMREQGRTGD